jgi:hypothetical protein
MIPLDPYRRVEKRETSTSRDAKSLLHRGLSSEPVPFFNGLLSPFSMAALRNDTTKCRRNSK